VLRACRIDDQYGKQFQECQNSLYIFNESWPIRTNRPMINTHIYTSHVIARRVYQLEFSQYVHVAVDIHASKLPLKVCQTHKKHPLQMAHFVF